MKWILIIWFGHGLSGGTDPLPVAYFDSKGDCREAQISLLKQGRPDQINADCIFGHPINKEDS